jgi:flagellar secretion chaperone FliS
MNAKTAFELYKSTQASTSIDEASPHRLITMMLDGALERVALAIGAMERGEIALTGESISKAISIIDNLRVAVDHERGGTIASNLAELYDYLLRRLLEANVISDVSILKEVSVLLAEIKTAWDQVPAELHHPSSRVQG